MAHVIHVLAKVHGIDFWGFYRIGQNGWDGGFGLGLDKNLLNPLSVGLKYTKL